MIDFYRNMKERINALSSDGYITYFEDYKCVGNGDEVSEDYQKVIKRMNNDGKKHSYNGFLVDYEDKKILYMVDFLNNKRVTLLLNKDKFVQVDTTIDSNLVFSDDSFGSDYVGYRGISSMIYVDGELTHSVSSLFTDKNNLFYEKISIAEKRFDYDLISNHEANKLEIRYRNDKPIYGKYNGRYCIGDDLRKIVEYANDSFAPIYSIFDDISYKCSPVKTK